MKLLKIMFARKTSKLNDPKSRYFSDAAVENTVKAIREDRNWKASNDPISWRG